MIHQVACVQETHQVQSSWHYQLGSSSKFGDAFGPRFAPGCLGSCCGLEHLCPGWAGTPNGVLSRLCKNWLLLSTFWLHWDWIVVLYSSAECSCRSSDSWREFDPVTLLFYMLHCFQLVVSYPPYLPSPCIYQTAPCSFVLCICLILFLWCFIVLKRFLSYISQAAKRN